MILADSLNMRRGNPVLVRTKKGEIKEGGSQMMKTRMMMELRTKREGEAPVGMNMKIML